MAYVAISEQLKTAVAHNIDAMAGSERTATFGENNELNWPSMELAPDDPLFDYMWNKAPELRGRIPNEWLGDVKQVDVHVKVDDYSRSNRYQIKGGIMGVPHRHAGYAPDVHAPETDTRFDVVRVRVKAIAEVNNRWTKVKEQVIGFLKACKSLNEAVKLYPDIIHYIPPSYLAKLNEKKVGAARDVSAAATKLAELDTAALSAAPVLARITGHK